MVTVLLRLAPDIEDNDLEEISTQEDLRGSLGGGEILLESTSQEIKTRASRLAQDLRSSSQTIKNCCSSFVMESMLEKKDRYEDDAEVEYNDLKKLLTECEGWIRTSELLVKQVLGEMAVGVELSTVTAAPANEKMERKVSEDSEGTTEGAGIGGTPRDMSTSSDTCEPNISG